MRKCCPYCKQNVNTESTVNWLVFFILLLFGVIPGLIYLIIRWGKRCPICHCAEDDLEPVRPVDSKIF